MPRSLKGVRQTVSTRNFLVQFFRCKIFTEKFSVKTRRVLSRSRIFSLFAQVVIIIYVLANLVGKVFPKSFALIFQIFDNKFKCQFTCYTTLSNKPHGHALDRRLNPDQDLRDVKRQTRRQIKSQSKRQTSNPELQLLKRKGEKAEDSNWQAVTRSLKI